MSRSTRRINNRKYNTLDGDLVFTEKHPETTCKPNCGVCGKGIHKRAGHKQGRVKAKKDISEQM